MARVEVARCAAAGVRRLRRRAGPGLAQRLGQQRARPLRPVERDLPAVLDARIRRRDTPAQRPPWRDLGRRIGARSARGYPPLKLVLWLLVRCTEWPSR